MKVLTIIFGLVFFSHSVQSQIITLTNPHPDSVNQYNEIGRNGLFVETCSKPLEDERMATGYYINEKREGVWMVVEHTRKKPRILIDVTFKDDKMNGVMNVYQKGKLKEQHSFVNDKLSGSSRFFSKSGKLIGIAKFSDDKFVRMEYDTRSKELPVLSIGQSYFIPHCFK
ncbi:MAG: hypothetical protein AAFY76_04855 [Cyanobacteria bacterium J06649_11]